MYMMNFESEEFYIKVYDVIHLDNDQILRTTGEFHGKEWFSNIAVIPVEDQKAKAIQFR
uniref:Uncharacterized protein n=1 Tax=Rhizophagus irregularis (strain DAOM 181602 / DAOM 197198 / MUCL 43194) TaxID=747089 RepID=U9SJ10_RHIID